MESHDEKLMANVNLSDVHLFLSIGRYGRLHVLLHVFVIEYIMNGKL